MEERKGYSKSESFKNFVKTVSEKTNSKVVKLEDSTMVPKTEEEKLCSESDNIKKIKKKLTVLLSDYQFTHRIGNGAFSEVYKVIDKKSQKVLALKQMNKDQLLYKNQMKYALT